MTDRRSKHVRRAAARAARRRRGMVWGAVAVAVIAGIGMLALVGGGSAPAEAAPDFELASPDGKTIALSDFRGQPVAVTFMHTW